MKNNKEFLECYKDKCPFIFTYSERFCGRRITTQQKGEVGYSPKEIFVTNNTFFMVISVSLDDMHYINMDVIVDNALIKIKLVDAVLYHSIIKIHGLK